MNKTLLIIDDVPANLAVLIDAASAHGYKVFLAEDGERGLSLAARKQPDLILLDVRMPGIDGLETCRRLKAQPHLQDIPVIFLTALDDVVDKVEGLKCGGVDYISKPIQPAEVLARVQVHLELRETRALLADRNTTLEAEIARRTEAENALRQSLDRALIVATVEGVILFSTQRASRLLSECFDHDKSDVLPESLRPSLSGSPAEGARLIDVNGGRLRVRTFAETGETECVTLLLETVSSSGPSQLEKIGLTPREAEVLYWIAQGKSNPEIAVILANTTGTVKKQVGRILEKLGLESRLAAALKANETLAPRD